MAFEQKKTYTWRITDTSLIQQMKSAKNTVGFDSGLFKFNKAKWYIKCCPCGGLKKSAGYVSVFLYLASMPSEFSKMALRFRFRFIEGNEISNCSYIFAPNKGKGAGKHKFFSPKKLKKHDTFTFEVILELIQSYDINGKEIEDETEYKTQNINSLMNVRINSLEARVDEIFRMVKKLRNKAEDDEKHDGNILNEIKNLKQEMNTLKQNMNGNNKMMAVKKDKLKKWLINEVELPCYFDIFVENGIEDLEVAKLITMDTLKEMDIVKIGHKMKIMQKVAALNVNVEINDNNHDDEGVRMIHTNQ